MTVTSSPIAADPGPSAATTWRSAGPLAITRRTPDDGVNPTSNCRPFGMVSPVTVAKSPCRAANGRNANSSPTAGTAPFTSCSASWPPSFAVPATASRSNRPDPAAPPTSIRSTPAAVCS